MPGRKAVFRLLVWNSLRPTGFILLYSLCRRGGGKGVELDGCPNATSVTVCAFRSKPQSPYAYPSHCTRSRGSARHATALDQDSSTMQPCTSSAPHRYRGTRAPALNNHRNEQWQRHGCSELVRHWTWHTQQGHTQPCSGSTMSKTESTVPPPPPPTHTHTTHPPPTHPTPPPPTQQSPSSPSPGRTWT